MMTLKHSTCMCVFVCVLVPGLYSEVDGSSEGNQVDFCLVKDGNLLTIFGEHREKKVKNRLMQNYIAVYEVLNYCL